MIETVSYYGIVTSSAVLVCNAAIVTGCILRNKTRTYIKDRTQ